MIDSSIYNIHIIYIYIYIRIKQVLIIIKRSLWDHQKRIVLGTPTLIGISAFITCCHLVQLDGSYITYWIKFIISLVFFTHLQNEASSALNPSGIPPTTTSPLASSTTNTPSLTSPRPITSYALPGSWNKKKVENRGKIASCHPSAVCPSQSPIHSFTEFSTPLFCLVDLRSLLTPEATHINHHGVCQHSPYDSTIYGQRKACRWERIAQISISRLAGATSTAEDLNSEDDHRLFVFFKYSPPAR